MRKIRIMLFLSIILFGVSVAHAQDSSQYLNKMFDELINQMMKQAEMTSNVVNLSSTEKSAFLNEYRQVLNKQNLMSETRPCFSKYTDSQIINDPNIFIDCTEPLMKNISKKIYNIENKYIYKMH